MTKIAIIGRPNVGKSSYFNRLLKKRVAIVDDAFGTTRDRLCAQFDYFGAQIELIDTAGLQIDVKDPYTLQAQIAIELADGVIMLVDGQVGPQLEDKQIAKLLLKSKKPLCLCINKIDDEGKEDLAKAFETLGIKKMFTLSTLHNRNCLEPIDFLLPLLPKEEAKNTELLPKIALLGQCNVGKSTLLNALAKEQRVVTSPIPATTRDTIENKVTFNDHSYLFIDTAGIKKRNLKVELVEKLSFLRTKLAIEECDMALFLVDATLGISSKEKKILSLIESEGKSVCIVLNKWDLVKKVRQEHVTKALHMHMPFIKHAPIVCLSALKSYNFPKLFLQIDFLLTERTKRIPTAKLNQFLEKAVSSRPPAMIQGKRMRIYYATQIKTSPPTFLLFVNHKRLMQKTYIQYLHNQFRKAFGFEGAPVVLYFKSHLDNKQKINL